MFLCIYIMCTAGALAMMCDNDVWMHTNDLFLTVIVYNIHTNAMHLISISISSRF